MKKLQGLVRLVIVSSSFFSLLCQARSEPDSVSVPFPDGKAPDGTRYKKSYKCEGEQISIGCKIHERIQVIRANYGRFSLAICNKHGSTDLSVNCMSPQSTGILKTKCDNLSNCTMQVNSHVFGEPCAGVQKYLEVHYACVTNSGIHSGTTPRLPPWLLEGGTGNLWQDNEDTYFERDDEVDDEDEEEDEEYEDSLRRKPILVQATTPVRIPITTPKPTTTTSSSTTVPESSSGDPAVRVNELAHVNQLEIVSNPDSGDSGSTDVAPSWGCPPSHSRFLDWNRTSEGEVSIQPCPSGTTGLARWMCGRDGSRTSLQPDMSDCKSQTMSELEASVRNEEPESVIASRLSILTGKRFFGGDLESSISVIKSVSNRLQYLIANREDFYNKESFVSDVFQNIFRSASNLFNNGVVWKDLIETSRRSKIASDLVAVLNECAFLWADTLDEPEIVYESTNNAIMAISSTFAKSQSFPSSSNVPEWFAEEETLTVRLPEISRLRKIVFFTYKNLNSLLPPKKLDANIVSHVVSAQLRRPVRKDEESETSVSVLFRTEDNMEELSCGRWDFEIGDWTRSGCEFVRKEDFAVECSCDSLGAFALLSSKRAVGKNLGEGDSFRENTSGFFSNVITLEIATYIISIVCFLILVLIVIQFRKQIQKLLRSSGCGGCCHCLDREDPDKSRDLYTGATLMETAAGVTSTTTTTASSSSATSSTSTTLPSRMVTTLSPDNRMIGNTPTIRSHLARESVEVHRAPVYSANRRGTTTSTTLLPTRKFGEEYSPRTGRPCITVNPAQYRHRKPDAALDAFRSSATLLLARHQYYSSDIGSFSGSYNNSPSHAVHTESTTLDDGGHVYAEIDSTTPSFPRRHKRSRRKPKLSGGPHGVSSESEDTVSDLQRISDFSDDDGYDLTPRNLIMNDKNISVVV